jgi:hypothetical protein
MHHNRIYIIKIFQLHVDPEMDDFEGWWKELHLETVIIYKILIYLTTRYNVFITTGTAKLVFIEIGSNTNKENNYTYTVDSIIIYYTNSSSMFIPPTYNAGVKHLIQRFYNIVDNI